MVSEYTDAVNLHLDCIQNICCCYLFMFLDTAQMQIDSIRVLGQYLTQSQTQFEAKRAHFNPGLVQT